MGLDEVLIAAAEAPPETRIEFRDEVASFGVPAIDRLLEAPWIGDSKYAAFAIQAIRKAGEFGAREDAVRALNQAMSVVKSDFHRNDIAAALASLGQPQRAPRKTRQSAATPRTASPIAPEDLVVGKCYRRSDLHDGGLGGNRRKGISYPADGTYSLLFSDPGTGTEYGYRDEPVGSTGYRYFGEWSGSGDMTLTGGNRVILDRSPELYLFTTAACGRVFRGRYEVVSWGTERISRDGREVNAIVFTLERVEA
jgi:hypothetical protein